MILPQNQLPLADSGGCACCSTAAPASTDSVSDSRPSAEKTAPTTTQTFRVTGMTCEHCVGAVTSEVRRIPGVSDVTVELDPAGTSRLTVVSDASVGDAEVATALDEAGDYQLAPR